MNESPIAEKQKKHNGNGAASGLDWLQAVVSAVIICVLIFTFVMNVTVVQGHSMDPTLNDGELLLVWKHAAVKPGDVVTIRKESFKSEPIVKRIIAEEGQTVDIDFDAGIVYVDGKALNEPYVNSPTNNRIDFEGPVEVPEGCLFVMGDNRNRSTDSRYAGIGFVDRQFVLGKAFFRIVPLNRIGLLR